jgi:protease I
MKLSGKRIAALVDNGFEQVELTEPKKAFEKEGARVDVVSPQKQTVKGWQHTKWGDDVRVDRQLDSAAAGDYDALFLPGGVMSPDHLRMNPKAVSFVKEFVGAGKPIAAICHGPWTLIDAGGVKDHRMTSWPSLRNDLKNAGAHWVDEQVVVDHGLVTSRKPDDIPAFSAKAIEEFAEGRHEPAAAAASSSSTSTRS